MKRITRMNATQTSQSRRSEINRETTNGGTAPHGAYCVLTRFNHPRSLVCKFPTVNLLAFVAAFAFVVDIRASDQANRLVHLNSDSPYYVSGAFPKLTTPMWVGEDDVEVVILLSVDDLGLQSIDHFERFLRPTLRRLKKIDGRAPVTIFVNRTNPAEAHLQRWLKEGLGLEVHTIDHPCPLLGGDNFAAAKSTVDRCIDLLNQVPNVKPTTCRVPCCDIFNTNSPQYISEIINKRTESGNFLAMDSSVHHLFTTSDKTLPRELVIDEADRDRFRKFTLLGAPFLGRPVYKYVNYVENYPYPYVVDQLCWEIPIQIPGDHQAAQYEKNYGKRMLREWKTALDATSLKQGVMTLCFHTYGKTEPEELIELIDYATHKHGTRAKFLTFADVETRLSKNLLAGQRIRAVDGSDNGIRLLDLNHDGFLDVVIANEQKQLTRVWDPGKKTWRETPTPFRIRTAAPGKGLTTQVQFGIVGSLDEPFAIQFQAGRFRAWQFSQGKWKDFPAGTRGLQNAMPVGFKNPETGDAGIRLRDIDKDGRCEFLMANSDCQLVMKWSLDDPGWVPNAFQFPPGITIVDQVGRDAGLRFVDFNKDGREDLIYSNKTNYAVYQYVSAEQGWSKKLVAGAQDQESPLPAIAVDGASRGSFFHSDRLWYINERTGGLADHAISIQLENLASLKPPNWIKQWLVLGPFPNQNEKGLDKDFGVEKNLFPLDLETSYPGIAGKKCTWQKVESTPVGGGIGFDLQQFCKTGGHRSHDVVTYLASWIDSSQAQTAELAIGSEDGVKAWLNGKPVHRNFVRRPAAPNQDRIQLQLKQGQNTLLIKLEQVGAGGALLASLHAPKKFEVAVKSAGTPKPTPPPANPVIHGYPGKRSYVAGENVTFHLSTNVGKVDIEIARIGAQRKLVWNKKGITAGEHPVPKHASSHGCDWPAAVSLEIPDSWPSGCYEAWTRSGDTQGNRMFFVVRSSKPGRDARILLQLSTNTYNAYNNWGGFSLYTYWGKRHWNKKHEAGDVLGRRVTFKRPFNGIDRNWELPFIQWAERNGYKMDYAINSDLEFHPEILKHYKLVLSVGHDEYWSAPMRDNLEAYIAKGGNVAFFSGNTCCWQVRSEEGGNDLVCWKEAFQQDPLYQPQGHPLLSTLWSHHLVNRPENHLTGVGFLRGGFHQFRQILDGSGAYQVHRPGHWVFQGTGLKQGEEFGGANTIVGYECDGCEFTMVDGRPVPTGKDGTPKNFIILGTAPAKWGEEDLGWYQRAHDLWKKNKHEHGCMGIYTKPGGGTVFTAATTDWSHGLATSRGTQGALDATGLLGPGHAAGLFKGGAWNMIHDHFSGKVVDENGKRLSHKITVEFGSASADGKIANWGKAPQTSWFNAESPQGVGNSGLMNDMLFSQGVPREQGGVRVRGLPAGEYEVFAPLRHFAVEKSARYRWAIGTNLDRVHGNSFVATGGSQTEWLQATDKQAGNFARAKVRVNGPGENITMIYDNLDEPFTDIMGFQIARIAGPDDSFRIQFDAGGPEQTSHVPQITRNILNRLSGEQPVPATPKSPPTQEKTPVDQPHPREAKPRKVPHNQPALITPETDGSLRLRATSAELHGGKDSKIAIYDKQMCIGWWTQQTDYVAWEVDAPRSGAFDASLNYSIPNNWANNLVEITAGPSRLVFRVPTTGSFDNFVMRKLGSLHLTKGHNRVVMRPLTPVNGEIADIKEVRLTDVDPAKPGMPAGGLSPAETTADLRVPEGYEVSLFASEPLLANPSSICVDSRGRVWVTEIQLYRHNYKWNAPQENRGKGQARPDRIKVLEDTNGDGVADKATLFYEGLMSPMSLAVAGDKVYVAEAPYLYVFEDKDGDLRADGPPRKLLEGFGGFNDDQSLHGLALGSDHKLYMTMGDLSFDVTGPDGVRVAHDTGAVIRCEMDGSNLEVVAWDLKNPLEVAVNSLGHAWFSGNDDDGRQMCRLDWTLDGGNYGWRFWGVYGKRNSAGLPIADAHWHVEQPGVVPPVKITGFGSPVGKMFVESNRLGDHLQGALVHADPGPREVRSFHINTDGAGFTARRELLLSSDTDTYFRPVDVAMGIGGEMYVADWYDQGVGGHAYNDPNRGRIYVVRKTDAAGKPSKPGPFQHNADAVEALQSENIDTQYHARQRLLESGQEVLPALATLANSNDKHIAARALWVANRIGGPGRKLVLNQLRNKESAKRALAIRILRGNLGQHEKQVLSLDDDPSPQVRREVLLAIRDLKSAAADKSLARLAQQWDGNDRWYLEAIGIAARGRAGQANNRFDRYAGYETQKLGDRARMKRLFDLLVNNTGTKFDHRTITLTRLLLPQGKSTDYLVDRLKREKLDDTTRAAVIAALGPNVDIGVGRSLVAMIGQEGVPLGVQRMALAGIQRNLDGSWKSLRKSDSLQQAIQLALKNRDLRNQTLTLVSETRLTSAGETVRFLLVDQELQPLTRAAAIDALAALGDIGSSPVIFSVLKKEGAHERVRSAGIRALAVLQHQPTLKMALAHESIKMKERLTLVDTIIRDPAGAAWLYTLINAKSLDGKLRDRAVGLGIGHADPSVRALYLQNVPKSERPKMLGASVDRQEILALRGDPQRGGQVFRAAGCINCHSVNGQGKDIGPGLSLIGRKLGREAILDSILDPSRAISPDYAGSIIEKSDGRTLLGFARATADGFTVRTTDGRFYDLEKDEIERIARMKVSLMPEQLSTSMTAQGLADLVTYLGELRSETALVPRWWVAGAFENDGEGAGFNKAYAPELSPGKVDHAATFKGIAGREIHWEPVPCKLINGSSGFDLQAFVARHKLRQGDLVTYHAVGVNSPVDQQGTLLIGSEDAVKAWINGRQIHQNFVRRSPAQLGQDRVPILLKKGHNVLMVKLEQVSAGGALIAALRVKQPVIFERP